MKIKAAENQRFSALYSFMPAMVKPDDFLAANGFELGSATVFLQIKISWNSSIMGRSS